MSERMDLGPNYGIICAGYVSKREIALLESGVKQLYA